MSIVSTIRSFARDTAKEFGFAAVFAVVGAAAAFAQGGAEPASASGVQVAPLAPSISQADGEPEVRAIMPAGGSITFGERQCEGGGFFSDTQAFDLDGESLGRQRWSADRTLTYWRGQGGRVTFDGVTFENHTKGTVDVSAWCD